MASSRAKSRVSRLPQWPPPAKQDEDSPPPSAGAAQPQPVPVPRSHHRTSLTPPTPTTPRSSHRPPAPLPDDEQPPLPPRDIPPPRPTTPVTPRRDREFFRSGSSPLPPPVPAAPGTENFGSCLQTCFEAINKRHDDELRALESLRVHIFNRAKADKEYAETLAKANGRAARGIANLNQASSIVQAWSCFLEVSENIQKQISAGAAQMSGALLVAVDQLLRDKRGAKKVFDAERTRLDDEFHTSSTEVCNLRRDYRRYLQVTEVNKRKLEASLVKENAKPQDQDKYRKRFVAHAEKLHSCHNNYTLSILNANAHQVHYRNSLLPFCLDTLQERMELQISEWKEAMLRYAQAMDLTQVYEESFQRLYDALRQVEKEEEYVEFVRENKTEPQSIELYEFDATLLQGYCSPNVTVGKAVINNLTHNGIKTRLATLEGDIETHQTELDQKNRELEDLLASPPPPEQNGELPTSPKDKAAAPPRHIMLSNLRAQIKELESKIARKTDKATAIKETVDELGDQPPPLFDPAGEGVDPKEADVSLNIAQGGTGTGTVGRRAGKSVTSTLKHGLKGMRGMLKRNKKEQRVPSVDETLSQSSSIERLNHDSRMEVEEDPEGAGSETSSIYEEPPEIPVEEEEWFFGDIDRRLSESKCKNPGDYLVRYSARQNKYVLTCNFNGHGKHFVIQQIPDEQGQIRYRFEAKAFGTIRELLEYHVTYGTPVTRSSGAIITKFVTKFDRWALQHDDVKRGKKIGKGCFGDVYEGTLTSGEKVAVKTCRADTVQDMDKFLKEADILKQYDHPNIVRLIGICAEKEPVYIVMELMPGGAFLNYLRNKGMQQTKKKLCQMCVDAACGMEYLESKNCIHRDLAARNCLVGDGDVVKISDFGMSREEEGGIYMVSSGTRQIPIKWTAPEALNYGKYTTMSDVWSFGVLLWEAFSCGSSPYPGMSNQEARSQVEVGYRMSPPTGCPEAVYGVMQQCWQYDPEERPNFADVHSMLQRAHANVDN